MLHPREKDRTREVTEEQAKFLAAHCYVAKQQVNGRWYVHLMLLGGKTERLVNKVIEQAFLVKHDHSIGELNKLR